MSRTAGVGGFLLDTRTTLLALSDPDTLSTAARQAILSGPNHLSVVSYWEVMLKSMKGTLDVGDPRSWWQEALEQLAATPLPLRPKHISRVYALPHLHKDPFDRVLIAQAMEEGFSLVTIDGEITRYASKEFRVIG